MRNKFAAITAVLMMLLTVLLAAPAASAGPAISNAIPVMAPQVVAYDDHQGSPIRLTHRASDEIYRSAVAGDCLTAAKFYPPLSVVNSISAVLLWVPAGNTRCNWLEVTNRYGNYWGKCINKNDWGYDFGADYNDDVWVITVKNNPNCPKWAA